MQAQQHPNLGDDACQQAEINDTLHLDLTLHRAGGRQLECVLLGFVVSGAAGAAH